MPLNRFTFFFLLVSALACVPSAFGQGAYVPARSVNSNVNGVLRPVAGAFITVCAAGNANVPCAPPLAGVLFKDQALTQPLANPTTTDLNGNYPTMALAAGNYTITETAVGFTGFSYQITVTCGTGGCTAATLTVTGTTTLNNLTVSGTANGECAVTSTASLSAANLVCTTSSTKIHIWPGSGVVSGAGLTIAAQLQVDAGSQISGSPTINGPIQAGQYQIFTGTPTIATLEPFNPLWFPGSDIIAQTCNAYGAFPAAPSANIIQLPAQTFTATSSCSLNTIGKWPIIQGAGNSNNTGNVSGGTLINYSPTTATCAFTVDWVPTAGGGNTPSAGFRDLQIIGSGVALTKGGPGGGSSANGICDGTTNGGSASMFMSNIGIKGFNVGWKTNGGVSFGQMCIDCTLAYNNTGYSSPNATEMTFFYGGFFLANSTPINAVSSNIKVQATHFDGNLLPSNYSGATGSSISYWGSHFETDPATPCSANVAEFVTSSGPAVNISSGEAVDDCNTGTNTVFWFNLNGGSIQGLTLGTSGRLPSSAVVTNSGGESAMSIKVICPTACQAVNLDNLITPNSGNQGTVEIVRHARNSVIGSSQYRTFAGAAGNSCTFTSGGGTSPSCGFAGSSSDSSGTIIATTGTGAPAASGTITLTFGNSLGNNTSSCVYMLSLAGAGQWNARATVMEKTPGANSDLFQWDNNAVALGTSTAFQINYWCVGR